MPEKVIWGFSIAIIFIYLRPEMPKTVKKCFAPNASKSHCWVFNDQKLHILGIGKAALVANSIRSVLKQYSRFV